MELLTVRGFSLGSREFGPERILSIRDFVKRKFCPGWILSMMDFVKEIFLLRKYFVLGKGDVVLGYFV